jgi:hypothetical protein
VQGPVVIGAIAGVVLAWIILALSSEGPKFPGDTSGSGPGCLATLGLYLVGGVIGAIVGLIVDALSG